MARERALGGPQDPRYLLLQEALLPGGELAGKGLDAVHTWCQAQGWVISRASVANYQREILGAAPEPPELQMRRAVQQADPALAGEIPEDPLELLDLLRRRVFAVTMTAHDPKVVVMGCREVGKLTLQIRQVRKQISVGGKKSRVVVYVPKRLTEEECQADD